MHTVNQWFMLLYGIAFLKKTLLSLIRLAKQKNLKKNLLINVQMKDLNA